MGQSSEPAAIYLINQISGHGHLDMYARLYSRALLKLGYRVVLISQKDPGARQWFEPELAQRFAFATRDEVREGDFNPGPIQFQKARKPSLLQRAVARAEGLMKRVYRRLPAFIGGRAERLHARIANRVVYEQNRWAHLDPGILSRRARAEGMRKALRRAEYIPPFGVHFGHIADEIRVLSVRTGWKPAFVLYLYLDMMSQDPVSLADLDGLAVPWAGIRFHPDGSYSEGDFAPERYFMSPSARGAIFLNPQPIAAYKQKFPNLEFVTFPDVTNSEMLTEPTELIETVKARANGRRTVLQLGTLSPHKGIFGLVDLIKLANPKKFFFVIAGEVFWEHYGAREQELRDFLENPPENCLVKLGYIEDERELNLLIKTCDVLYAVYRDDFRNSSNTITKAAIFERPILVKNKFLMGERVSQYRLGEAVTGAADDTLFWLEEIVARGPERFGFQAFRQEHSLEALESSLARAMALWLPEHAGIAARPPTVIEAQPASRRRFEATTS